MSKYQLWIKSYDNWKLYGFFDSDEDARIELREQFTLISIHDWVIIEVFASGWKGIGS